MSKYTRQIKYQERLRAAALAFLGGKCAQCGFADPRALQIDHIVPVKKTRQRRRAQAIVSREILAGSQDYQILCANCNWIKRALNHEHR